MLTNAYELTGNKQKFSDSMKHRPSSWEKDQRMRSGHNNNQNLQLDSIRELP
jgi:hypothetical protein